MRTNEIPNGLESLTIQTRDDELKFIHEINEQLILYLQTNHVYFSNPVHSFLLNKIYYYSALELGLPIRTSWYLYGPHILARPEDASTDVEIYRAFSEFTLASKSGVHIASCEPVQKVIQQLITSYQKRQSTYDLLKQVYTNMIPPDLKKMQNFYLTKMQFTTKLADTIHENPDCHVKQSMTNVVFDLEKELLRSDYSSYVQLSEKQLLLTTQALDYVLMLSDNLVESDEQKVKGPVMQIPCSKNSLVTVSGIEPTSTEKLYSSTLDYAIHTTEQYRDSLFARMTR